MKGKIVIGLIGMALFAGVGAFIVDRKVFKATQAANLELERKLEKLEFEETVVEEQFEVLRKWTVGEIQKTQKLIEILKELTNGIDPTKIDIQIDDGI